MMLTTSDNFLLDRREYDCESVLNVIKTAYNDVLKSVDEEHIIPSIYELEEYLLNYFHDSEIDFVSYRGVQMHIIECVNLLETILTHENACYLDKYMIPVNDCQQILYRPLLPKYLKDSYAERGFNNEPNN